MKSRISYAPLMLLGSVAVLCTAIVDHSAVLAEDAPDNNRIVVPATVRANAAERARLDSGREDPFTPIAATKEFPAGHKPASGGGHGSRQSIPPPPPGTASELLPPPPPTSPGESQRQHSGTQVPHLAWDLPEPPAKPLVSDKLKLVGIVADKALFIISDRQARLANKWPSSITLSQGEQFQSVSIVSIDADKVILEEDGTKTVKELERVR